MKGNKPQLFEDIRLLFAPLSPIKRAGEGLLQLPEQQAQTQNKGHGRLEIRSIRVSSELKGFSDWPGLGASSSRSVVDGNTRVNGMSPFVME